MALTLPERAGNSWYRRGRGIMQIRQKPKDHGRAKTNRVIGFQVQENECLWMKAGVIEFRLCDNAYDCYHCPFDKGMRKTMGLEGAQRSKGKEAGWVQYLRERYNGPNRPCRHALSGRVTAAKICPLNYECYHCPYDQILDEMDFAEPIGALSYELVSGIKMAQGFYYHRGHGWARFEHGGRVRVGFDDFLAKLFGSAGSLDLPPVGASLAQNEVGCAFTREGNEAAVLSPVTGTVLAVNHKAQEDPQIPNHDPYQMGWLFIVEPRLPKRNLKGLYFDEEAARWMEQENQTLMSLMGPEYDRLVATGGEVVNDIYGHFPNLGWQRLVGTFLHT